MFSPTDPPPIAFFESTPRSEKATFDPIAKAKQSHVNDRSAAEAIPTPPMTGRRHMFTCHGSQSFMKMLCTREIEQRSSMPIYQLRGEAEPTNHSGGDGRRGMVVVAVVMLRRAGASGGETVVMRGC